jgi:hypothetical protein
VQIEWERALLGISTRPEAGTKVVVRFELTRNGRIQNLAVVRTDNPEAAKPCIAAITRRAPYSAWTAEMVALLGEKQEMTFSFEYL